MRAEKTLDWREKRGKHGRIKQTKVIESHDHLYGEYGKQENRYTEATWGGHRVDTKNVTQPMLHWREHRENKKNGESDQNREQSGYEE